MNSPLVRPEALGLMERGASRHLHATGGETHAFPDPPCARRPTHALAAFVLAANCPLAQACITLNATDTVSAVAASRSTAPRASPAVLPPKAAMTAVAAAASGKVSAPHIGENPA